MSHSTPTPAKLVQQWLPRLRRIAWKTGIDLDDIKQEGWLLAAAGVRNPEAGDFVPRWLAAVERHAGELAKRRIIEPPPELVRQVEIAAGLAERQEGDPAAELEGAQAVAKRLEGLEIKQLIDEPRTTREIAQVLGKSERQARRDKKRLEEFSTVQGDFWGGAGITERAAQMRVKRQIERARAGDLFSGPTDDDGDEGEE